MLLLALLSLAPARAGQGDDTVRVDLVAEITPEVRKKTIDLFLEGELLRLGLPVVGAERLTASVESGIAAPERAVREGRASSWGFGHGVLRVERRRVHDGARVVDITRPVSDALSACTHIAGGSQLPVEITPLDHRGRLTGADDPAQDALAVVFVPHDGVRTALSEIRPRESFTVVELVIDAGAPDRRRARRTRRLDLDRRGADLVIHEDGHTTQVCIEAATVGSVGEHRR